MMGNPGISTRGRLQGVSLGPENAGASSPLTRTTSSRGITDRETGSTNKLLRVRNGIPRITSCDASEATLRVVDGSVLTLSPVGGENFKCVVSSLEIRTDFRDSRAW